MILAVYDNSDIKLKYYFEEGAKQFLDTLSKEQKTITAIVTGRHLTNPMINLKLENQSSSNLLFVAHSHGNKKALTVNGETYLDENNIALLEGSCVFAIACSSASQLGNIAIEKGVQTYVGFKNDINAILANEYKDVSIRCDNYPLLLFFHGNQTIKESIEKAKEYFNQQIDKIDNFLIAALLVENRDALIALGNQDLTLEQLFNTN